MTDIERVNTSIHAGVATIELDNPGKANMLTAEMTNAVADAWAWAEGHDDVRAIVFTGSGDRHFCGGVDTGRLGDAKALLKETGGRRLTGRHCGVSKPIVAAVNGIAVGAGVAFTTDADIVVASRNASFVEPHVRLGQIAGYAAFRLTQRLPVREVALCELADLPISAERAYALGFVNRLRDTPDEARATALDIALRIAAHSPTAIAVNLELFRRMEATPHADAVVADALAAQERHWDHPDAAEGLQAFMEKRPAQWASRTA